MECNTGNLLVGALVLFLMIWTVLGAIWAVIEILQGKDNRRRGKGTPPSEWEYADPTTGRVYLVPKPPAPKPQEMIKG